MIRTNNNLTYSISGIIKVDDFTTLSEYHSYMNPNNIILSSYMVDIERNYRNYSGYSYEIYYLDNESKSNRITYSLQHGNGLNINENGLISIDIDDHTLQQTRKNNDLYINAKNLIESLDISYSESLKGLIIEDNSQYGKYFSYYIDEGYIEKTDIDEEYIGTNNVVSLHISSINNLLGIDYANMNLEIDSLDEWVKHMFNPYLKKYNAGDILYINSRKNTLVDNNENFECIPYLICVLSSNNTIDEYPRFARIKIQQSRKTGELAVNTQNLDTAYSDISKGLIVGDNKLYRNYFSEYYDKGYVETNNGIVSLNEGFLHDILEISELNKTIDLTIDNLDNLIIDMFKSKKYKVGDILYIDTKKSKLIDEKNSDSLPYLICVISSDVTDDGLPRFTKIEEQNYKFPASIFTENVEGLTYLNSYVSVPIFEVPWENIKVNSNVVFSSYGFIATDRKDWEENLYNKFNDREHYYFNPNFAKTGWYLDASYITYNNPNVKNWTIGAGGIYTYNLAKDVLDNVSYFIDLTDEICVIYNNIIKHYKVDLEYDKINNRYVSKYDCEPVGGTGGVYTISEKSVALNVKWSNILENPYKKIIDNNDPNNGQYRLFSAFIPYREKYDLSSGKLEKNYISSNEFNPEKINHYDWEWKQDKVYKKNNAEISKENWEESDNFTDYAYIFMGENLDMNDIPNIGIEVEYSYQMPNNGDKYLVTYSYFIYKSKYYSYIFTSTDRNYMSQLKNDEYYDNSLTYYNKLYDAQAHSVNWKTTYNNILYLTNLVKYGVGMNNNKPKVKLTAVNLNDLSKKQTIGEFQLTHFTEPVRQYKQSVISYFFTNVTTPIDVKPRSSSFNVQLMKQLRDYSTAEDGPVYFKPDVTYITTQQSDDEYLLHHTYGNIINEILDYKTTYVDYYLHANRAEYNQRTGTSNILSDYCVWLYDPYKILKYYDGMPVLISLNIYSVNEEISINKLFKFTITHDGVNDNTKYCTYIDTDWYDGSREEYLLNCEQEYIDRITFNYAIDYEAYEKNRVSLWLEDVTLAPEGTVIYQPPVPVEEPDIYDPGSPEEDDGQNVCAGVQIPDLGEMWIIQDYIEHAQDSYYLHDMSIGMRFNSTKFGEYMINGIKTTLEIGQNVYILYFQISYTDSYGNSKDGDEHSNTWLAFTYRNNSGNNNEKKPILKLCISETISINKNSGQNWSDSTEQMAAKRRNDDLIKFKTKEKFYDFIKNVKFKLKGISCITSKTQQSREFIDVSIDKEYSVGYNYTSEPIDKGGPNFNIKDINNPGNGINMTERVTVLTGYKYFQAWSENPPRNRFGRREDDWGYKNNITGYINEPPEIKGNETPDTESCSMTLSNEYALEGSGNDKLIKYIGESDTTGGISDTGGNNYQDGNTDTDNTSSSENEEQEPEKTEKELMKDINDTLSKTLTNMVKAVEKQNHTLNEIMERIGLTDPVTSDDLEIHEEETILGQLKQSNTTGDNYDNYGNPLDYQTALLSKLDAIVNAIKDPSGNNGNNNDNP